MTDTWDCVACGATLSMFTPACHGSKEKPHDIVERPSGLLAEAAAQAGGTMKAAVDDGPADIQWEHQVMVFYGDDIIALMNKEGAKGWEAIAEMPVPPALAKKFAGTVIVAWMMKRRKRLVQIARDLPRGRQHTQ